MCACMCACANAHVCVIVKHPVLPPCAVDGCSRNLLGYVCENELSPLISVPGSKAELMSDSPNWSTDINGTMNRQQMCVHPKSSV